MPTWQDNWSLVVPDAMACGLRVLCSKFNGGWPELAHEDENGYVFSPLVQENFVSTLTRIIELLIGQITRSNRIEPIDELRTA